MAGETVVGNIVAYLRLDASDWNRTLTEAGAAAQALGDSDPSIDVEANTGQALAALAAVSAQANALADDDATVDVGADTGNAFAALAAVADQVAALSSDDAEVDVAANTEAALAQLGEVEAAAAQLGGVDVTVDAHVNAEGAEERLVELRALAETVGATRIQLHVDADTDPAERALARAERSAFGLVAAVATLGPALIPMTGAVAGLGLAFGGLGAAGVLAVIGVKKALENGSEAGVEFQNSIDTLNGNLDVLAATAAGGILDGFAGVVSDLQGKMPEIQNGIGVLSTELGQVMQPAADGITTSFIALLPLMTDLAGYARQGAEAFDAWAQGDGIQQFGGYAMSVIPQVLDVLGELIQLAGNVSGAFSGWGLGVLSIIGSLASMLNSLDPTVLTVVATGGLAIYTAFKGYGLLTSLVSGFGGALGTMATNMGRLGATSAANRLQGVAGGLQAVGTAGSVASLAVGGITAVLGIGMFAWSMYKQKQQEAKQAQEAMTQAIQEDSGALGENAQKVIAKTIADGDLISKAKSLGIGTDTLTQAFAGNSDAIDEVNQKARENGMVSRSASGATKNLAGDQKRLSDSAIAVTGSVAKVNKEVKKGKDEYDANKLAASALGDTLNTTSDKMSTLELSSLSASDAARDQAGTTQNLKQEIDKLNQSLQEEISKQLQLQGGLTGEAAARNSMIQTLKKQKSSTDLNTDSGVKQRQAIEGAVGQIQSYIQTQEKAGMSTSDATATYKQQGVALLQSIARTDGANSSTYKYAQQLLKLPKDVKTKVATSGTEVSVSQLKGMKGVADALGNTRIKLPADVPNAGNVTRLLNDISEAALSADHKSVSIATASPQAVVTKLKLKGIDDAAVSADRKSVTIPTKTLNQPRTVAAIEEVLNKTKDKSMTITARDNRLDHVLGQLGAIDRGAHDRSFTVQAFMVTTTIQRHVDERLSRDPGYNARANGGVTLPGGHRYMADGGVVGRQAMIARAGSMITWAEDSTGGESYIPWAASKRPRALQVLAKTADGFGFELAPRGATEVTGGAAEIAALASHVSALSDLVGALAASPTVVAINGREIGRASREDNRFVRTFS